MSERWRCPTEGWIVGEIRGQKWFSDGHAMFRGDPPGRGPTRMLKTKVKHPFEYALRRSVTKRMRRTSLLRKNTAFAPQLIMAILKGPTCLNEMFYEFAEKRFPGVQFFLGKKQFPKTFPVICKVGRKLVGVIQPMRWTDICGE